MALPEGHVARRRLGAQEDGGALSNVPSENVEVASSATPTTTTEAKTRRLIAFLPSIAIIISPCAIDPCFLSCCA